MINESFKKRLIMKMNKKYISLLLSAVAIIVVASCNYKEENELDGKGINMVRLRGTPDAYGVNTVVTAYNAVPETRTVLELNRDAISAGELNTSMTINFEIDTTIWTDENIALDTVTGVPYTLLPAENYTLNVPGLSGNTLTFGPGEANKPVELTINPEGLDFTLLYGIPIRLSNPSDGYVLQEAKQTVILQIIVKNSYDGKYTVTGTMVDATAPQLGPYLPSWEALMVTAGPNSVYVIDNTYSGQVYHPIFDNNAVAPSVYGNFGLVFEFNSDGSGEILNFENYYNDPAPRHRTAHLVSGSYDPATKSMDIVYTMNQDNLANPVRSTFTEHWAYKGAR